MGVEGVVEVELLLLVGVDVFDPGATALVLPVHADDALGTGILFALVEAANADSDLHGFLGLGHFWGIVVWLEERGSPKTKGTAGRGGNVMQNERGVLRASHDRPGGGGGSTVTRPLVSQGVSHSGLPGRPTATEGE